MPSEFIHDPAFPGKRIFTASGECPECNRPVHDGDIHACHEDPPVALSGKKMCEFIAEVHLQRTGETIDPEAIWNASPAGELYHVWDLYAGALAWRNANIDPREDEPPMSMRY